MRPREIFKKYGPFSEARSSTLSSPISNWTTHVGPSVHGLKTLFSKPPCDTSVRATNARKPDDNIANWAENKQKTMPKGEMKKEKEKSILESCTFNYFTNFFLSINGYIFDVY